MNESRIERLGWVFAAMAFVFVLAVPRYPYLLDEVDFVKAGLRAGRAGSLQYYAGEEAPAISGLWHPPTYIGTIGATTRILGETRRATTFPGAASFAVTLVLLLLFSRKWFPDDPAGRGLVLILFSTCPLALAAPLLIEIDTSWLTPALLWSLNLLESASLPTLMLCFCGCLSLKMTTPLLLPVAVVFYRTRSRSWFAGATEGAAVLFGGGLIFVLLWKLVSFGLSLEFSFPFEHTFINSLQKGAALEKSFQIAGFEIGGGLYKLLYKLWMGKNVIFWVGPGLLALALAGSLNMERWIHPITGSHLIFLWATFFGYLLIRATVGGFPKYVVPIIPLLILPVVNFIRLKLLNRELWRLLAAGFALALFMSLMPDSFESLLRTDRRLVLDVVKCGAIQVGSTALMSFFMAGLIIERKTFSNLAIGGLLIHTIGWGCSQTVRLWSPERSVLYCYGDRGIRATADRIKQDLTGDRIAIMPKDLATLVGSRYYGLRPATYTVADFEKWLADENTIWFIDRLWAESDLDKFPVAREKVLQYFVEVERQNSYRLFKRKSLTQVVTPAVVTPAMTSASQADGKGLLPENSP